MEEIKLAAAHYLCIKSNRSTAELYRRVMSVVRGACGCYDTDDPSVSYISDDDFADMMFVDGCFLLQFMSRTGVDKGFFHDLIKSWELSIIKDMMLLENQIPWLVVKALAEVLSVDNYVQGFVIHMGNYFFNKRKVRELDYVLGEKKYNPPHLLGLLWCSQIGSSKKLEYMPCSSLSLPISITACWLVNMAALEAATVAPTWHPESDGYVVTSYLSTLAMLMDREEDVHELRGKRVLRSIFSNTQTLVFFKGLGQHLQLSGRYFRTLEDIDDYKRHRPVRTAVHKFLYKHYKTIAALLSIAGVLVGIFKALYSIKKP